MSWSVSIPATPAEDFAKALEDAHLPEDTYNKPSLVEQWREQLEAAKAAAQAIFAHAYAFGHAEGDRFSVSMTGHANHDGAGEGTDYTPSEFVYVNVHREP